MSIRIKALMCRVCGFRASYSVTTDSGGSYSPDTSYYCDAHVPRPDREFTYPLKSRK